MASPSSSPAYQTPEHLNVLLHKFLNNPGSLFEHKIFTTFSLLMRNFTEQLQDYRGYYYSLPDQTFNASSSHFPEDHETDTLTHHHHERLDTLPGSGSSAFPSRADDLSSTVLTVYLPFLAKFVATLLCILSVTWVVNTRLLRRNRLIQYWIEMIICHMIVWPMLPFIAVFYFGIGIVRLGIWLHIQIFHKGKRFMVSPEDGFWAYEEHASSSGSIGLYMIEGKCDLEKIKRKVKEVVAHPVVRGRMYRRMIDVFGFAVWETVKRCDTNDHIRIAKFPKNDRRSKDSYVWTDKDVLDFLTTFQDKPMNKKRPAWEVVIIPDMRMAYNAGVPHYACIFRMHHAIMDGISSANILHQILADKSFKFTIDPVETNAAKRPGKFLSAMMYLASFVLLPRTGLINGLLNLDNKTNKYFVPGPVLKGPKHFAWSKPFKMDAVKKIKDETKSSVMTVLLSTLGGSFRKMDDERKWKKESSKKMKSQELPEFYHALAPVALLPYPDRHPRNGFSGIVLPVAVGKHANARDRLNANHKEFKRFNFGTMDVLGNFILISMVGLMPTKMQKIFGCAVHAKMSLSNIPGSDEEIRIFGGDKIVEMGAWLPCKFTLGMAMGLFSYGGKCRATIVGDQSYLSKSDVESLVTNFETEIYNLGESLGMTEGEIFVQ